MALSFDQISKVCLNRESIRLKVKVVRLWTVPMYNNPSQAGSLEMILVDEHGGKIQATVRKPLLYKFSPLLEHHCVYKMVYFNVVPNSGNYRATIHEFKLVFLFKTTVVKKVNESIPNFGLTFVPFDEIMKFNDNHEFLIDVIGVLTHVFPERQYEKDGKMTTMVVMELTDASGKLECALFGDYVDQLRTFLQQEAHVQVIVVIQLARVKTFRGKTVIQNSMNATNLLFNPDIPEAISFRNTIAEDGVIDVEPLAVILDNSREGLEADFMRFHPKKWIEQLQDIKEDGMFIVLAKIVDILSDGPWFYMACNCNRSVTFLSNVYFCESCHVPVLQVSPRFKVKVEVVDESGGAIFVLFDRDVNMLLKKSCEELLNQSFEDSTQNDYPQLLASLIGRRMLFKVETKVCQSMQYDGTFPVRRVCADEDIIAMFDLAAGEYTPTKAIFTPPFSKVGSESVDLDESFSEMVSDYLVTPISLGDDDFESGPTCIPAKRCLQPDFIASQDGHVTTKFKTDHDVAVEDVGQPSCSLVAVKLEKD